VAERNRQKRQLSEQAVKLAMQSQWQEAVDVNRQFIEIAPDETEAWNRLGKAFSELGRYSEARDAYNESLQRDANNIIAQKQLRRLALLVDETSSSGTGGGEERKKVDPRLLIEETGKTGLFELDSPAAPATLARMAAGDEVHLRAQGNTLNVENDRGEVLGQVPPRAALRIIDLMGGGNKYIAGVTGVTEKQIRVLIREIEQAPELQGRVSFPSKGGPLPPELRAYTKDRAMRFDLDDDAGADDDAEDAVEGEADGEESTSDIEYYEEGESSNQE
jgi:tetratricopeptide (TPR) repeat protein